MILSYRIKSVNISRAAIGGQMWVEHSGKFKSKTFNVSKNKKNKIHYYWTFVSNFELILLFGLKT